MTLLKFQFFNLAASNYCNRLTPPPVHLRPRVSIDIRKTKCRPAPNPTFWGAACASIITIWLTTRFPSRFRAVFVPILQEHHHLGPKAENTKYYDLVRMFIVVRTHARPVGERAPLGEFFLRMP